MDILWLRRHRPAVLVFAAGLPLLSCAIAAQFRDSFTPAAAALVLVLLIVAAAATGDRLAGVLAAVSGGAWFDFFLTAPFRQFTIDDSEDVEVTVLLVLVGVAVTEIALWGRRQEARASSRAGYLDGVMTTSQIAASELAPGTLADHIAAQIATVLDVDSCRFQSGAGSAPGSAVLGTDGEVRVGGTKVDVDRDGLPPLDETVLPAQHHGIVYGLFLITAASRVYRPALEQRRVAVLLANQVGAAHAPDPTSS